MTESEKELLQSVASKFTETNLCPAKYESAMKFIEQLEKQENLEELFNQKF